MTVERRLYAHAFVTRLYFYVPVLLHHMEHELSSAGVANARALSLSVLSFLSIGMIAAEYPSGVFADWLGRKRSIVLSGVVQSAGILLFLIPGSLVAMGAGQFLIGVGTAFRNGADSALLHGHLEQQERGVHYGRALARLRFFNVLGIATGSALGGTLYQLDARAVFVLAALACTLGLGFFVGLDEPPVSAWRRSYRDVLRESFDEVRENHAVRSLMILGGFGNPYFVLAFWVMQAYLVDLAFPFVWMGLTVASMSLLQGLTMPLSGWLSGSSQRLTRVVVVLVVLPPLSFVAVALATRWDISALGTLSLIVANGCHLLYRNAINVRLQGMVPDNLRSSIVSVEAGIGSLWYAALFPLAGWLLEALGLGTGLLAVAAFAALTLALPFTSAVRAGALRSA